MSQRKSKLAEGSLWFLNLIVSQKPTNWQIEEYTRLEKDVQTHFATQSSGFYRQAWATSNLLPSFELEKTFLGAEMSGTQDFVNIFRGYCYFAESALHIHNRLQWQVNQFQVD